MGPGSAFDSESDLTEMSDSDWRDPTPESITTSLPWNTRHRDAQHVQMRQEITGKVVGPISAAEFIAEFLPTDPSIPFEWVEETSGKKFEALKECKKEQRMYSLWVVAMQHFCPNFDVIDTSFISFKAFMNRLIKPDVSLFKKGGSTIDRQPDDENDPTYMPPGSREATLANTKKSDIKQVESMGEFKYNTKDDPFQDDVDEDRPFEKISDADAPNPAYRTLGQVTNYGTAHQAGQFRTHAFSFLIFPEYGRLLRWDRAGVVVTEKIKLTDRFFPEFFWRLNYASPSERGVDTTVTDDLGCWNSKVREIRHSLQINEDTELLRIFLRPGEDDSSYIVGKETYMGTSSPTGRATRTFTALSYQTGRVVFLKDTWRVISGNLQPEHEIYEKLEKSKVENIAQLQEGTDIANHATRTRDICEMLYKKKKYNWLNPATFRNFRHYRLVLKDVGRDLTSFSSVRELVAAMRDAATAHRQAFFNANILHRDISVGNIIITSTGRGLLIDWDLCKDLGLTNTTPQATEWTGTWQFMAARLLEKAPAGRPFVLDRQDDVESFFLVLTWVALVYTTHDMDTAGLSELLSAAFDSAIYDEENGVRGGITKRLAIKTGEFATLPGFKNPPLLQLLNNLVLTLAVRYQSSPSDEVLKRYKNMKASLIKSNQFEEVKFLDEESTGHYLGKLEQMNEPQWLEQEFNKALAASSWDIFGWPNRNKIESRDQSGKMKRKNEDDFGPRQKKVFVPVEEDITEEST